MSTSVRPQLALVGDRGNHNERSHPRLDEILPQLDLDYTWVPTTEIDSPQVLAGYDGIYVVPGAPYHNQHGVHIAIQYARETGLPFIGTCGGFFSALLEHAQNVIGLPQAQGVDQDPSILEPLMMPLTCSYNGEKAPLKVKEGSLLARIYGGADDVEEIFHCAYGLQTGFMTDAEQGALSYCAWDADGSARALELAGHPFFFGCLFQPELSSQADDLHPILAAYLREVAISAAEDRKARAVHA
ncbi:glutamine amidotransferase-related protein [Actinoplanes sp. RD1]|uniref:glutamine amidotransferase-related protein n=1 Tax=Actinoplanes sp. RD1 TaxID=3064538 RepID=UPI0027425E13|nr:hypothetical protein [Actinoplanes sp. RD1]